MIPPYYTLAPPAGLYRNGTIYQSKGRWYDANLFRFKQDQVEPIGGWQLRSATATAFANMARAALSWRDNSNNNWISVGTSSHLYVQDEAGANHDITPVDFTPGRDDATQNLGYGGATYGSGFYGVQRPNTGAVLPATVWSLDSWGEDLVGCSDSDGKLYQWNLITGTPATVIANAPTDCVGLLVTQEFFLFALGATGDGRRVAWCDQQNNTLWTADATNQAGDYDLPTVGTLQCGKALPSGALCFTDVDVWEASYIGAPLVYSFRRVGSGCGVISKGAVAAVDSTAVWMGPGPVFWLFDGQAVQPLDCDVLDFVADMNTNQSSKVTTVHVALYGEIWWFYPSSSSNECDTYAVWCYRESARLQRNVWSFGKLNRTCGTGKGVFTTPLMVDPNGLLWLHESGLNWGGVLPFIEMGPVEIGDGSRMAEIQRIIPDEQQDGNFTGNLFGRLWPDSPEFSSGAFQLTSPTEIFFQAREIRPRWTLNQPISGRIGIMRLEMIPGDPL